MNEVIKNIQEEIEKVVVGKRESVKNLLLCLLSGGHALLDDIPGVGKTTLALSLCRALALSFCRVQCTPDLMPSDITGFTVYNKQTGQFEYKAGAAVGCHLLLCDEINRASGKTQSALLEAMQEEQVTVDGVTRKTESPFMVIATQNRVGSIGTQPLPYAQLDRFAMRFSLGYPTADAEFRLLKDRAEGNPLSSVRAVCSAEEMLSLKEQVKKVTVKDNLYRYIALLAEESRKSALLEIGVSPRACLSALALAKANAFYEGRDYCVPQDIRDVFPSACAHRMVLSQKAVSERKSAESVCYHILKEVKVPDDKA